METTSPTTDRSQGMDEKSWWDLWNTSYRTKDDNDENSTELFERAAAVISGLTKTQGGRLLEVACGSGALSRRLAFSNYHGLDISPAAIDIARKKGERASRPLDACVPVYEAVDFHDWPLPSEPFDVVACVDAISCFRDQQLVLTKIARSLRVGGHLVLTTINPFVYVRIKRSWENGPVSHWLSRRELHTLVVSAGLTVERSFTIMPRGHLGMLRLVNSRRVDQLVGKRAAAILCRFKEGVGLGQYRIVVARKDA